MTARISPALTARGIDLENGGLVVANANVLKSSGGFRPSDLLALLNMGEEKIHRKRQKEED